MLKLVSIFGVFANKRKGFWGILDRFYLVLVVLYFFKGKYHFGVFR